MTQTMYRNHTGILFICIIYREKKHGVHQPMTLNGQLILLHLTMSFTVISQTDIQPIIETNFSKDNMYVSH